jgi:septal ring factor EnvC (AmiA/AmiB activator)
MSVLVIRGRQVVTPRDVQPASIVIEAGKIAAVAAFDAPHPVRQAVTLEEQHQIQKKIQKLERQHRRQRHEIFQVEDEIMEKRDGLIDQLEKRLAQRTAT